MLLVLIASLCENNELPMLTLNDNPDGFPLPKGTGMTGEKLRLEIDCTPASLMPPGRPCGFLETRRVWGDLRP